MTKGIFVAIEGVGGTGRRTLADEIELKLAEKGIYTVVTEEPSDGAIGRRLRKILEGKLPALPNSEFQKLLVKDRAEQIKRTICPFLNLGRWVISAGYWLSTLACGMLDGSLEEYMGLHEKMIGREMIYPDMTLLLDAPVEICLARQQSAGRSFIWADEEARLTQVRLNYFWLGLAKVNDKRFGKIAIVNASKSKEEVLFSAIAVLHEHFNF